MNKGVAIKIREPFIYIYHMHIPGASTIICLRLAKISLRQVRDASLLLSVADAAEPETFDAQSLASSSWALAKLMEQQWPWLPQLVQLRIQEFPGISMHFNALKALLRFISLDF